MISIFIITLISNFMINDKFDLYLVEEQQGRLLQISQEINKLYLENGYQLHPSEINSYASLENIYIQIKDLKNRTVCSSSRNKGMGGMGGMGGMHNQMMGMHRIPDGNYVEKSFNLLDGDTHIGTLILGYIDNSYLTDSAVIFKDTLTKSFHISGIVTIILGVLISLYLSKSLTTPLIDIRNTAVAIRKGNLNFRPVINTNTTEIVELSDSINYLSETLANQENIRKRYASDISHELRTPITTLKSHLEAIIDGVWEPSNEHLTILMMEVDRLSGLVNDLKDSFNSEEYALNLNKTKFNLSKEMNSIITTFLPIYNEQNYNLRSSIKDNIEVNMDKDKLKQIIYNLLSNSIKYLNPGGTVRVELEEDKHNTIIKVIDNGIGIEKQDLPHIFDRFYRSDTSRNRSTGGTGLGLSIVKSLVEAHKGSIDIDSKYGAGTVITIMIKK